MRAVRALVAGLAALAGFWASTGCQSIAGIEDRHYEPAVQASDTCRTYCDDVMKACTGANAAYATKNDCLRVCAELPSGEAQKDNSIECRAQQASLATQSGEPASDCPGAGPFGADICGSSCQALCTFLGVACPKKLEGITDCATSCSGLREDKVYDLSKLGSGDDVECRLNYAVQALADDKNCDAAALKSTTCKDDDAIAPNCADICKLTMVACTSTNQVFSSASECEAYCKLLPPGKNSDEAGNTAGCRKYHSYNSLAAPNPHCAHAGPGGDGHCGSNCEAYCGVMASACKTEFDSLFPDPSKCPSECALLAGSADNSFFSTPKVGNTLTCRLINLAKAALDSKFCSEAAGQGECSAAGGDI